MQMPPPPPPSSSTDGGYLGIPAMSNRLKALEEKILRQIGPIDSPTTPTGNRTTSRNLNLQTRQIPSRIFFFQPIIFISLCFPLNSQSNGFTIITC